MSDLILIIVVTLIKSILLIFALLTAVAYTTLAERKLLGFFQLRYGPNRVGPWGLLQPLADGIKLMFKEDVIISQTDRMIYILAPGIALAAALTPFLAIPFADRIAPDVVRVFGRDWNLTNFGLNKGVIADIDVGLLFVFAISSISVYGVILAGWSSNNKYSLLGGIRVSAQMISYELSIGLSVIGILMIAGTLSLTKIVEAQSGMWFVVYQPLGFIIYLTAAFAEACRTPFDLIECENELVAGYHTEYSSMKFGLLQLSEYAHIITISAIAVTLFWGGWQGPWLPSIFWFVIKTCLFIFLFIWVRATFPRFRFDQLIRFGWKVLLPLSLFNLLVTGLVLIMAQ